MEKQAVESKGFSLPAQALALDLLHSFPNGMSSRVGTAVTTLLMTLGTQEL